MDAGKPDDGRPAIEKFSRRATRESDSAEVPTGPARARLNRLLSPPGSWLGLGTCSIGLVLALGGASLQQPAQNIVRADAPFDAGWFLRPFEINVADRAPTLPDLYAVDANADGRRVWAAGAGPTIWHSTDAGRTWEQQRETNADQAEVLARDDSWLPMSTAQAGAPPHKDKLAPQQGSSPPTTFDSMADLPATGKARTDSYPPTVASQAKAARNSSSATAYPASAADTTAATTTTVSVSSPSASAPPSAPFSKSTNTQLPRVDAFLALRMSADGLTGWVVGTAGRALHTDDGGAHWEGRSTGLTGTLRAVAFDSPDDVWVAGDGGQLMRSFDQGRHWNRVQAFLSPETIRALALAGDRSQNVGLWVLSGNRVTGITRGPAPASAGLPAHLASGSLLAISLQPGRAHGIAVGNGATLVTATGKSDVWQAAPPPSAPMAGVAYPSSSVIAVGTSGLETWRPGARPGWQALRVDGLAAARLLAISFADRSSGWAVGEIGQIVTTQDGGTTWHWLALPGHVNAGSYHRYPPPWTLLSALAALAAMGWLVRRASLRTPAQEAVRRAAREKSPGLSPDAPVANLQHDRLGHARAVRALDGFIRNVDTDPRLTIAITAPWGQGKSSVMRMLQAQLEAKGYRTAWFNAWHHQQEARPLSALFTVIASQALPPALPTRLWLRARLLWMRGFWYRALVLLILLFMFVLGTDVHERLARPEAKTFWETTQLKFASDVLGQPRLVLTTSSLDALDPCPATTAVAASAATSCSPCATDRSALAAAKPASGSVRPNVWCYARQKLLWQSEDGRFGTCRRGDQSSRCEFANADDLLAAVEHGSGMTLTPDERQRIATAAEPMAAPELLPFTEKMLPAVAIVLGLLITKGGSVYGFELFKPLRLLLSPESRPADGKEPTGSIERYRVEFNHLADALKGRLVIFIDDLDRCNKEMVNSVLELSNYLTDVGDCYIVLGADLAVVKQCILAPGAETYDELYANRYLRKLIHIEMPVPLVSQAGTSALLVTGARPSAGATTISLPRATISRWAPTLGWLAAALLVVFAAIGLVARYDNSGHGLGLQAGLAFDTDRLDNPGAVNRSAGAASAAGDTLSASEAAPATGAAAEASNEDALREDAARKAHAQKIASAVAVLFLIVCAAAILLSRRGVRQALARLGRRTAIALGAAEVTHDSAQVEEAMQLWHRLVYEIDNTPRGAKRFRNKARLFGMLLAGESAQPDQARVSAVALVALSIADPSLLQRLLASVANKPGTDKEQRLADVFWKQHAAPAEDADPSALRAIVSGCLSRHAEKFGEFPRIDVATAFAKWAGSIAVR